MASLVDRGDSYHVIYLGSCLMAQMSTGLGVLQKPLRELYFKYRQSGGGPAAQERYLLMSGKGMTMTYKENASAHPTEVFYSMPDILFWDAVQFVTVRGTKKVMGAFEPLDNNHSRNKDNLFAALEKKYHFLQQMTHPPLFTCVLRRTTGVKCLDVHAFVCSSEDEGLGLVEALNTIQNNYNADEVQETGVFGYKPFGGQAAPGASEIAQAISRKNSSSSASSDLAISRASSMRHLVSMCESPDTAAGSKSATNSAERKQQNAPYLNNQGRGFQLTQEYFAQSHGAQSDSGLESGNVSSGGQTPDDEHVYQYIGHIDKSLPKKLRSPDKHAPPAAKFSGDLAKEAVSEVHSKRQAAPQEYASITKSVELLEDTISPAQIKTDIFLQNNKGLHASRPVGKSAPSGGGDKLGQGYTLLSGSGSPLPGQEDRDYNREYGEPETPELPRRLATGSPAYGSIPRPSLLAHYRNRNYDGRDYGYEYDRLSENELRAADRPRGLSREDIRPPSRSESGQSIRSSSPGYELPPSRMGQDSRHYSPPGRNPSRPVAKVPPHKITGVKVLPAGLPVLPSKKTSPDSPERSKYGYIDDSELISAARNGGFGLPQPRRAKSQYLPEAGSPQKTGFDPNWQFTKPVPNDYDYRAMNQDRKEDNNMNDKLLLNQKKDAEIASVLQNLRFDYDGTTMTPGVPAGNNFERSLGYFP